jgi:hypothetical protein
LYQRVRRIFSFSHAGHARMSGPRRWTLLWKARTEVMAVCSQIRLPGLVIQCCIGVLR